ncbi:hypothetical protein [Roseovarius sp. SYSU LYC5161]|uniref:hypothetical protein n=1 Tax=Roseovarius halophilus (ex Wu et al. 2025) TaxID=3376060 RepID=UPI003999FC83
MNVSGVLLSVLLVGHSLFGKDTPQMLKQLLSARGPDAEVAFQIINGAPLVYNWEHGHDAEGVNARDFLARQDPGVVILTEALPLDDHLEWSGTHEHALKYYEAAVADAPGTRVFLQQTWPSGVDTAGWTDAIAANRSKWQGVVDYVNRNTALPGPSMRLLPAGDAMLALDAEIEAGRVPGIASISALFDDDVHLSDIGHYFVASLQYAVITGENPVGLPRALSNKWGKPYEAPAPGAAERLQEIAWRVAQAVPDAAAVTPSQPSNAAVPTPETATETRDAPDWDMQAKDVLRNVPQGILPAANATIGIGLTGVNDWSVQQPFLNVMKTARPWIVHKAGQWGGGGVAELRENGVLDADGWPVRLPRELGTVGTVILTDLPAEAGSIAGRYRLSFDGTGVVEVMGRAENKQYGKNEVFFDFTPGDGPVEIRLRRSDPARTGDYVRNIRVVKVEHLDRFARGEIFNPLFLSRIRDFDTLRYMDWMDTNHSQLSRWRDRPRVADYTYASAGGVPLEIMLELARQSGTNAWFNMPHQADDDYVRRFARTVRDGLGPETRVYVEFSNEVWNWAFSQAKWASARAAELWGNEDAGGQFYGMRAAQVARIWSDVFAGAGAPGPELVNVISTQTGWLGLEESILNAPLWQESDPDVRAPVTYFDAYAVTGYFGGILGTEDRAGMVRDWLAESRAKARQTARESGLTGAAAETHVSDHAYDMASRRAGLELLNGTVSGDDSDTLADLLGRVLPYHARVAAANDLDLVMYEGGTHLVGIGSMVDDAALTRFFTHFNYTPQMGRLYEVLLAGWRRLGGGQFNAYADMNTPSKWGSWGALRYLTDDNPRWRALVSARDCDGDCDRM